jgi:hypothetical protein
MRHYMTVLFGLLILVSCGKDNRSGQSNTSVGINPIGPGVGVTNPYVGTVMNEYPCLSGMPRTTVQIPLNMTVAVGGTYVGVTSEGDVALVSSNGGQGIFTAYICGRTSAANGTGSLLGNPVINRSYNCQIDEVTSAAMNLPTLYGGTLRLNFRPIYFPPGSSLCQ